MSDKKNTTPDQDLENISGAKASDNSLSEVSGGKMNDAELDSVAGGGEAYTGEQDYSNV